MPDQPVEQQPPNPAQSPQAHARAQPPLEPIVPDGAGKLFYQPADEFVLCRPHLMPLKSVTLEKLERMHRDAQQQLRETRARTAAAAAAEAEHGAENAAETLEFH